MHSTQADKKIMEALRDCGCNMLNHEGEIEISGSPSGLKAFHFDATDCPDLFPPLVALAAYCKGTTAIDGVSRLAHKESATSRDNTAGRVCQDGRKHTIAG